MALQDGTIEKWLKSDTTPNARLSCGDRRLIWAGEEWLVCGRSYGQKKTRFFYAGQDLEKAISILREG